MGGCRSEHAPAGVTARVWKGKCVPCQLVLVYMCFFVLVHVTILFLNLGENHKYYIIIVIIMHPMASAHLLIRQTYLYLPAYG